MCLAVPGQLLEIRGEDLERSGRVRFGGVTREVSLACLPEARVDDYVLVHAGLAISRLDADEAEQVFRYLEEIGLAGSETEVGQRGGPTGGGAS